MATTMTEKNFQVSRHEGFCFYGESVTTLDAAVAPTRPWELDSVRLHLISAIVSVVYLRIWLSCGTGMSTPYNLLLLSLPMSGVLDVFWGPERTMILDYGDQLLISCGATKAHEYGLAINGWAVTG